MCIKTGVQGDTYGEYSTTFLQAGVGVKGALAETGIITLMRSRKLEQQHVKS